MSQSMMKKTLIAAALFVAANAAFAQAASAPVISPAKTVLINKLIQIQQPGIDNLAKSVVQQMLGQLAYPNPATYGMGQPYGVVNSSHAAAMATAASRMRSSRDP